MEGAMGEVRRIAVEDAPPLEELLAAVERGETVDPVRDDRVVARMGRKALRDMTPAEVVEEFQRLRRGVRLGEGVSIREALGRDD